MLITPADVDADALTNKRSLNVALLGCLSAYLSLPEDNWIAALRANFPGKLVEANRQAFYLGRSAR